MRAARYGLYRGGDLDRWERPRQPVGTALAQQGPGLGERPHALLQKERVALRPRDQHALERIEAGVGPEQSAESSSALSGGRGSSRSCV